MRGRLIFPMTVELFRLDTLATAQTDPDGAGPLVSGYDTDFKEPVRRRALTGQGAGTTTRVEKPPIRLRAQIEVGSMEKRQMFFSGNSPEDKLICVFDFDDLERLGLVNPATGRPLLNDNDRLHAIYSECGDFIQTMDPPLYATQVEPSEYGLGGRRNLCVVYFSSRDTAVQGS